MRKYLIAFLMVFALIVGLSVVINKVTAEETPSSVDNPQAEFVPTEEKLANPEDPIALLIQDRAPWGRDSNQWVLQEFDILYDVINSSSLNWQDLSKYQFIIYASAQSSVYYRNIATNLDKINDFVSKGGLLLAHSCDGGWDGTGSWQGFSILPGDVTHLMHWDGGQYLSQSIHITDPNHRVAKSDIFTLTDAYLSGWGYSTHGIFTNLAPGTNVVMMSGDGSGDGPTYIEYDYGTGKVLATMQTIEWGYFSGSQGWVGNRPEFLRNEIRFALSETKGIFVMLNNTPEGAWRLRPGENAPDFTKDPLMEVPNGWMLKLVNRHQDEVKAIAPDGKEYIWWEVQNPGNEVEQSGSFQYLRGWMASKRLGDNGAVLEEYLFLPGSEGYLDKWSSNYEEKLKEDDRKGIIVEAIKHYYNEGNSSEPGFYNSTNIYTLNDTDFPIELVLAIAAQESGFNKCGGSIEDEFNNEVYGDDGAYHGGPPDPVSGGVGIMQITTEETRGCGSGLKCYAGTGELAYRALESSLYFDPPYSRCGYTRHQYYTNTIQGIYANIKDALYLIKNNYDQTDYCIDYIHSDGTIITKKQMQAISTVQRYNAGLTGLSESTKALLFTIAENLDNIEDELDKIALNTSIGDNGLPSLKNAFEQARQEENSNITLLSSNAKVVIRNSTGWRLIDTGITNTDKTYLYLYSILRGNGDVYRRGVPVKYVKDVADKVTENKSEVEFKNVYDQSFNDQEFPKKMNLIFENSQFISLGSSAELRIYDSDGNITGLLAGEVIEEIPNSIYNDDSGIATIFVPSNSYQYEIIGTGEGTYELDAISVDEGVFTVFNAVNISTSDGAMHQYTIDWDDLSQGQQGVTVQIDFNGDGAFELIISTSNSFLSAFATIDVDPDTLNLKSKGKWVTCYIELSESYNVEEIRPDTIRLWVEGDQILAEEKPTAVGDYDADGIPDLMVKFSRSALAGILKDEGITTGGVTLTINGQVGDSIFEGTDTIRIVKITGSLEAPGKPTEFALLQNFANPFNPDTWIPYQLAEDADVVIRIYTSAGRLVHILNLGHKPAGFYTTREKAAYWDGKNESGEQVASGIYFYTIQAGDFTATKKMVMAR